MNSSTPYEGDTARRTPGCSMICRSPRTPRTANHTSITGAKTREIRSVPYRWAMNSAMRMPTASGMTHLSNAVEATSNPSTALRTEMAGVIKPSP